MEFASLELPADLPFGGIRRPPPIQDNKPTDYDIARAVEFKRQVDTARTRLDRDPPVSIREVAVASVYEYTVVAAQGNPPWLQPVVTHIVTTVTDELKKAIDDKMRLAFSDQMKQGFGDQLKQSEERMGARLNQMERAFGDDLNRMGDEVKRLGDEVKRLDDSVKESEQRTRTELRNELKQLGDNIRNELKQFRDEVKVDMNKIDTRLTAVETELRRVHHLAVRAYIKVTQRDNGYFNDEDHLDEVPFPDGIFPWGQTVAGPVGSGDVQLPPLSSVQAVGALGHSEVYGYFRGYYPNASNTGSAQIRKKKILAAIGRHDVPPQPTA